MIQGFDIVSVSQPAAPNRTSLARTYKDIAGVPISLPGGETVLALLTTPAPTGLVTSQVQKNFASYVPANPAGTDIALYTVSTGKTFSLTDFAYSGSPSSGNPLVVLKYNTTISSGAITSSGSAQAVTITNTAANAQLASGIYVGGYLDIDTLGGGSYERVQVTAVSATSGIVTGFSAVFASNHSALATVGVPLAMGLVTASAPIREMDIRTAPTAPAGSTLTLNVAAYTGTGAYEVRGIEQ